MSYPNKKLFLNIATLILTTLCSVASANSLFDANDVSDPVKIWPLGEFQKAPPEFSITQLIDSTNWQSAADRPPSHGFTDDAVWFRFPLINSADSSIPIRFFWHHAQIHDVDIYLIRNNSVMSHIELGTLIPIEERPHKSRMIEWTMEIPPGEDYQLYVRAESKFGLSLRISAGSPKEVEGLSRLTENSIYLYIGLMIALAIYNIPLAITTRSSAHWFYLAYVLFVTIYVVSLRGVLFQLGLYNNVVDEQRIVFATVPLFLSSSLLFAGSFLNISQMPKIFRLGFWALLAIITFLFLLAVIPEAKGYVAIVAPIALSTIIFTLICSAYRFLQGEYYAGFIFIGWLAVLFGIAGHQISILIGVQTDVLSQEAMKIGTALEATLFSWALGYRMQSLQKENQHLKQSRLATLEQANQQLQENFQIEAQSSRQKDDLLVLIGQELKTPLDMIQSSLELVKVDNENLIEKTKLEPLNSGVDHLRRNVSNIILLTEINAGELQPLPQTGILGELIQDVQTAAKSSQRHGQNWQFSNSVSSDLIINIDDRLLHILLDNLIENAFKFSPRGNIQLTLNQISQNNIHLLEWIIKDDGIGIPEDRLNQIFELFYQSENEDGQHIDGMGLGLPLARRISELLGGKISITSKINSGSTVTFIHPVDSHQVDFNVTQLNTAIKPKVLIAEQNAINAQLLEKHMAKLGYITRLVDNGIKVVDACKYAEFQLIMINIHMPVLDGIETATIIRNKGYQGILLAISANETNEIRKRAIDAGFDSFIEKPIRFQNLQSKIKSITSIVPARSLQANDVKTESKHNA